MVATLPKLILLPIHPRMEASVYSGGSHPEIRLDPETSGMFIMKSEDKVGLPRIDRWHPRGKSIVTGLFRRAIQDIAADGKADHLLELLQDPHNVWFEYIPLPCQYDDLPLSSAELIADINTTVDASSVMIPKALIYGIQLDPGCLAAASYRKFLFAAGLIPSAESFLASLRASWSLNRVSAKQVRAHKQVEAPPQTVAGTKAGDAPAAISNSFGLPALPTLVPVGGGPVSFGLRGRTQSRFAAAAEYLAHGAHHLSPFASSMRGPGYAELPPFC